MSNGPTVATLGDAEYLGNETKVQEILTHHPEVLQQNPRLNINYFLRSAARRNKLSMVKLFVKFGADIHAPDGHGDPPAPEGVIDAAATDGAIDVVRWLLDNGAKVNFQIPDYPQTRCMPLTGAVIRGHLEVVKLLVEKGGANVNANWAITPLAYAIMYHRKEIEDYLRSKGALGPHELK